MTRMTGPDCAVKCNLINIHTHTLYCIVRGYCTLPEFVFLLFFLCSAVPGRLHRPDEDFITSQVEIIS